MSSDRVNSKTNTAAGQSSERDKATGDKKPDRLALAGGRSGSENNDNPTYQSESHKFSDCRTGLRRLERHHSAAEVWAALESTAGMYHD